MVNCSPVTRPADCRTVRIDVRHWWLGVGQGKDSKEELVVHIYDAAGHRVYRASHGGFVSAETFFLHVVRSDASEAEAAAAVLEWVEAVQQEASDASSASCGHVWTWTCSVPPRLLFLCLNLQVAEQQDWVRPG